jgi:V8-like Glu-specific endopeptidase
MGGCGAELVEPLAESAVDTDDTADAALSFDATLGDVELAAADAVVAQLQQPDGLTWLPHATGGLVDDGIRLDAQAVHELWYAAHTVASGADEEVPPWFAEAHDWRFIGRVRVLSPADDPEGLIDAELAESGPVLPEPEGDLSDLPLVTQLRVALEERPILIDGRYNLAFQRRSILWPGTDGIVTDVPGSDGEDDVPAGDEASELFLAAAPGEDLEPRGIFDGDDRRRVDNTTARPWRNVARLFAAPVTTNVAQGRGTCSASLTGPRVLFTAAHCFYRRGEGGGVRQRAVVPGATGPLAGQTAPLGIRAVRHYYLTSGYRSFGGSQNDFGFLVLADSVGYGHWLGMQSVAFGNLKERFHTSAGYPGEVSVFNNFVGCVNSPDGSGNCLGFMYQQSSPFVTVYTRKLLSRHDLSPGQSGSPLIRLDDAGTGGPVRAVMVADRTSSPRRSVSRRVTSGVIDMYCGILRGHPSTRFEAGC